MELTWAMTPSCRTNCWSAAALAGASVTAALVVAKDAALGPSVLLGILIFAIAGALVSDFFCSEQVDSTRARSDLSAGARVKTTPRPIERIDTLPAQRYADAPQVVVFDTQDDGGDGDVEDPRPRPAAGLDAALARLHRPSVAGSPELLSAPRGGKPDDLKAIHGIGPALEKLLNGEGVWHYDQIAGWRARDIAYIDARMPGFHGRITRDQWIRQARELVRLARGED